MTTFADSLKREIARVARKELRDEIASLRKSATLQRSEVAALKRHIQSLQSEVRTISKAQVRSQDADRPKVEERVADSFRGRPRRKVLFTAERLKTQRVRLGFTQEQMAKLLGVSSLSIWKWESGAAEPRASRVPLLLERLSLGKRDALALVDSASS